MRSQKTREVSLHGGTPSHIFFPKNPPRSSGVQVSTWGDLALEATWTVATCTVP